MKELFEHESKEVGVDGQIGFKYRPCDPCPEFARSNWPNRSKTDLYMQHAFTCNSVSGYSH